ncbi:hypothetical protein BC943DRAFT_325212 [Umbelopsis sp. AD052]|nr:hypothetical protein BC943DRAFT_325212 [Umbelopsis sp. AD052]
MNIWITLWSSHQANTQKLNIATHSMDSVGMRFLDLAATSPVLYFSLASSQRSRDTFLPRLQFNV